MITDINTFGSVEKEGSLMIWMRWQRRGRGTDSSRHPSTSQGKKNELIFISRNLLKPDTRAQTHRERESLIKRQILIAGLLGEGLLHGTPIDRDNGLRSVCWTDVMRLLFCSCTNGHKCSEWLMKHQSSFFFPFDIKTTQLNKTQGNTSVISHL